MRHDGKAENIYETKEAVFEAAVAAAFLGLRQGHEVRVSAPGGGLASRPLDETAAAYSPCRLGAYRGTWQEGRRRFQMAASLFLAGSAIFGTLDAKRFVLLSTQEETNMKMKDNRISDGLPPVEHLRTCTTNEAASAQGGANVPGVKTEPTSDQATSTSGTRRHGHKQRLQRE